MCDIMREVKEEGIAEGRRVGLVEGIERGRTAGLVEGIEQTIVQMYKRGKLSQEEACENLNFTLEQFAECVEKYEKQD